MKEYIVKFTMDDNGPFIWIELMMVLTSRNCLD